MSGEVSRDNEYVVAWIDCLASKGKFGRGVLFYGNHFEQDKCRAPRSTLFTVPINAPGFLLNSFSMRSFNALYYNLQRASSREQYVHYTPFFYPLDAINDWNKIYGKNGFLQFQCVVPNVDSISKILEFVVKSGTASFLAVLKEFGDIKSPGLLSFPRTGTTICLDFPMRGEKTLKMFAELENYVRDAGGALYPAKDATMSEEAF